MRCWTYIKWHSYFFDNINIICAYMAFKIRYWIFDCILFYQNLLRRLSRIQGIFVPFNNDSNISWGNFTVGFIEQTIPYYSLYIAYSFFCCHISLDSCQTSKQRIDRWTYKERQKKRKLCVYFIFNCIISLFWVYKSPGWIDYCFNTQCSYCTCIYRSDY